MTTTEQQPFESGGGNIGLSAHSAERLYLNARAAVADVHYLVERQVPWALAQLEAGTCSRVVGRFLMHEPRLTQALATSPVLEENIEAVVPVGTLGGESLYMAMWGMNAANRRPLVPVHMIMAATDHDDHERLPPGDRIAMLKHEGFGFTSSLDAITTADILGMWGPIFGWEAGDIDGQQGLRARLSQGWTKGPEHRMVWFGAVTYEDNVVALATAERLDLPIGNGEFVHVVESTEWCVRPGWSRRGLATGAASYIHAQVFRDLATLSRHPIVIAETNFTTRVDNVGHASGMQVPDRNVCGFVIPQVLRQNVSVGDGMRPERLRDFTMMFIPDGNIQAFFSPQHCLGMLEEVL